MFKRSKNLAGQAKTPPRVVILGGGYGGVYTALGLQRAARRGKIELVVVSRENYFVFQPLLAEVISGSIEPPHVVNPIRRLLPAADFYRSEAQAVNTDDQTVIIRSAGHATDRSIHYDHLVIAVGNSTDLSALPGVAEHAFALKTLGDAFFLRNHLIDMLEQADEEQDRRQMQEMLTFVVAGGGYTGIEVSAEINDFVREAARSYRHVSPDDARVILLQGRGRILPELSGGLATFSHRLLEKRGVEIRLNTRLRGATAQSVILLDGSEIASRTLVATVGSGPNRVLDAMPFPRDERGRLVVDETLSVPDRPNVWAVGDCAAVPDPISGGTAPPTAQYALREAKQVARNILATLKGGTPRPFSFSSLGVFVPLGRFSAAAEVWSLRLSGWFAWWLYRTYYLYQLPRVERKVKVVIDWTSELIFRRDIVQIDTTRSEVISRAHFEPGQFVFSQGNLARSFFIVVDGTVEVFRELDGQEAGVATLGPGEFLGEMALLAGGRHTASARAATPVDVLVMNGDDFKTLADKSSRFGEMIAGVMRRRRSDAVSDGQEGTGALGHTAE